MLVARAEITTGVDLHVPPFMLLSCDLQDFWLNSSTSPTPPGSYTEKSSYFPLILTPQTSLEMKLSKNLGVFLTVVTWLSAHLASMVPLLA